MKRPLLKVYWTDITTNSGWQSPDDDYTDKKVLMVSVGWKLKSNKASLVITPMIDVRGVECCNDRQIIPRGAISKLTRLE